jgi:hypothetical protein
MSENSSSYHFSSEELIQSCPLPATMFSHKSAASLTVTASKIEPLSAFLKHNQKHLEYNQMEQLIEMIGRQLHHLEVEQNKGIAVFHVDDITVFHADDDAVYFSLTNANKIHDIDDENNIEITTPYRDSDAATTSNLKNLKNIAFYSPEMKEFISKKTIPYKIHFKSSYYSFGLLCLYCYVSRTPIIASADNTPNEYEKLLAPIINTKIYWFLKQVLQENPTSRRYICV